MRFFVFMGVLCGVKDLCLLGRHKQNMMENRALYYRLLYHGTRSRQTQRMSVPITLALYNSLGILITAWELLQMVSHSG